MKRLSYLPDLLKKTGQLLLLAVLLCTAESKAGASVLQEGQFICKSDIASYCRNYTRFAYLEKELAALYSNDSAFIWFDDVELNDFAYVVYNNAGQMANEGLPQSFPYAQRFEAIFNQGVDRQVETELLISSLYLFYNRKVYGGLSEQDSAGTGWHLPREKTCLTAFNDSLGLKPSRRLFGQYYNLKKGLQRYLQIEQEGGWDSIAVPSAEIHVMPGDSAPLIRKIRTRLYIEGYLNTNSGSLVYDRELRQGIDAYRQRQHMDSDSLINAALIDALNINVTERIRCIAVNMERCRWIPDGISNAPTCIAVNIPSYRLLYIRDGITVLESKVVVGTREHRTAVFTGDMAYIVFSPFWNVPSSIYNNEIAPQLRLDPRYLDTHNMEWHGKQLRQRPGPGNPLGQVKFIFPNSNSIYLHDTPSRSLFEKENRAFSHGCIRVARARELAIAIMQADAGWTESEVDNALNSAKERYYTLKHKIPVYIAYFTAWADQDGKVSFFDDIYQRDKKLQKLLLEE
ncbi:L,D-transpeptidase [Flavobacterium album]|uniref:L,D-transpeptidase n=1 Tax=Flavobacterium album TaxID=2175091 RepID=A0A2S1R1D0_9FLAO|nr:L,D-transpeptidase family protein [Flavobacterium album]AWH86389.1 L,D-transpeptidase [Flavobacterium album]